MNKPIENRRIRNKIVRVLRDNFCFTVYREGACGVIYASEQQPFTDVGIFRIKAGYTKRRPPNTYYVYGRSLKEAKQRFYYIYASLTIYEIQKLDPVADRLEIQRRLHKGTWFPV